PPSLIHQLSMVSKNVFDVRKIAPEKKYTVLCTPDSTKTARAFVYEPNPLEYVVIRFDDTLSVDLQRREVTKVEKSAAVVVNDNLSQSIESLDISHELTNMFVDIFAWQVDFQRLQKGDKFKIIYEENQVEGKFAGINRI